MTRDGADHARSEDKPTPAGDARIWFYVGQQGVYREQVYTRRPNATN